MRKLRLTIDVETDLKPAMVKSIVQHVGQEWITITGVSVTEIAGNPATADEPGIDGVEGILDQPSTKSGWGYAIGVIFPYWKEGAWVFDDDTPGIDLKAEPFVLGASEAITRLVEMARIPDAENGFALYFSDQPFPQHQFALEWAGEEGGGNWYWSPQTGDELWLCAAMFHYFEKAPMRLFVKAAEKGKTGSKH
jgi:hypothetical protein